jgi:hypothetical protein
MENPGKPREFLETTHGWTRDLSHCEIMQCGNHERSIRIRGRGLATEVARALTEFALADARVRTVHGHTKPDNAASARVLEKCGFHQVGEVIDPEDGPVVRWEREPAEPAVAPDTKTTRLSRQDSKKSP